MCNVAQIICADMRCLSGIVAVYWRNDPPPFKEDAALG